MGRGKYGDLASIFYPATDLFPFPVSTIGLGQWLSTWCHSVPVSKGTFGHVWEYILLS